MYSFVLQEDLKVYDEFIEKNKGQYIQCSRWQNVKTTWNCRYYCGFDETGEKGFVLIETDEKPLTHGLNAENIAKLKSYAEYLRNCQE